KKKDSRWVCPNGRPGAYVGTRWAVYWSIPRPHLSGRYQTGILNLRQLVGGMGLLSYGNQFLQHSIIHVSRYIRHAHLAEHQLIIGYLPEMGFLLVLGKFEIQHDGFVRPYQ